MNKIGIDFDNTIVCYDQLFYKIAREENLVPIKSPVSKIFIREYLRSQKQDDAFTFLQGEVYGRRILEATPAKGVYLAIKNLLANNFEVSIISHKSKYPYKGPKYNLHDAAKLWLDKNNFISENSGILKKENIFFNLTKEKKIEKIHSLGCDYFIDDLPEILKMIEGKVKKILYSPNCKKINNNYIILRKWSYLNNVINFKK